MTSHHCPPSSVRHHCLLLCHDLLRSYYIPHMRNFLDFIIVQTRYAAYHRGVFYSCSPIKTLMAFARWAGFIAHQCYITPRGHGKTMPALPGNNFVIGGNLTLCANVTKFCALSQKCPDAPASRLDSISQAKNFLPFF